MLREYRLHPERKFHGTDGQGCRRLTRGVLPRRPVDLAAPPRTLGKEANKLDEVRAGLHAEARDVLTEYDDPDSGILHRLVLPVLDRYSGRQLAELLGMDRRTVDRLRSGQRPRPRLAYTLLALAGRIAERDLIDAGVLEATHPRARQRGEELQLLSAWSKSSAVVPTTSLSGR